ncbi:MAG: Uma2 family endonuclease [Panacagrimonas sp.]
MLAAKTPYLSPTEYLDGERLAQVRHEYVDGMVYAMSGASRRHNDIALNVAVACRAAARSRPPCSVHISDVKLYVAGRNTYYYPDVVVSCATETNSHLVEKPCAVIEVLSPETETTDRREKRAAYLTLPTLREYVLITQDRPEVVVIRRGDEGWIEFTLEPDDPLYLSCLKLDLALTEIYAGVSFDR